ncbi:MAG TPA: restriction endonuclease [Thermoanaerobaculia bacterium]|nr:restriction endonuclease [Thermoanaerobaculia bacterium]
MEEFGGAIQAVRSSGRKPQTAPFPPLTAIAVKRLGHHHQLLQSTPVASNRKSYNLAKAKLSLYEKWYRRMGRFGGKMGSSDPIVSASAIREHRKAKNRAGRYFEEMLASYHAIDFPLNSESLKVAEYLNSIDSFGKSVYVMKTGFGKGISFDDSQIARILGSNKAVVHDSFIATCSAFRAFFEEWTSTDSQEITIEIAELTPDLIRHLQRNEEMLNDISWQVYEQLIAEFFASWGYQVSLVGRNSETSADIIAIRPPDKSGIAIRYFVEVKKWEDKVGVETINQVLGAIYSERVNQGFHVGVIVASNGYKDLRKVSTPSLSYLGLELRDGNDVKKWLSDYSPSKSGLWLRTT